MINLTAERQRVHGYPHGLGLRVSGVLALHAYPIVQGRRETAILAHGWESLVGGLGRIVGLESTEAGWAWLGDGGVWLGEEGRGLEKGRV